MINDLTLWASVLNNLDTFLGITRTGTRKINSIPYTLYYIKYIR